MSAATRNNPSTAGTTERKRRWPTFMCGDACRDPLPSLRASHVASAPAHRWLGERHDEHIEADVVVDQSLDHGAVTKPVPARARALTGDQQGYSLLRGETRDRERHVVSLQLHDLRTEALRHLNVVDEPPLDGGVDSVRLLVRCLNVHAVPVRVEAPGDSARFSQ